MGSRGGRGYEDYIPITTGSCWVPGRFSLWAHSAIHSISLSLISKWVISWCLWAQGLRNKAVWPENLKIYHPFPVECPAKEHQWASLYSFSPLCCVCVCVCTYCASTVCMYEKVCFIVPNPCFVNMHIAWKFLYVHCKICIIKMWQVWLYFLKCYLFLNKLLIF